ncbi:MAG: trypsin-like peptidase domain-containing protein [Pseudomonadales bacterium]|nr:trypsin-like peptidase domain-containing protein [Pseudomonadales bacterium]
MKSSKSISLVMLLLSSLTASVAFFSPAAAPTAAPDFLSFRTEDEANNIEIFRKASPSVVYVTNTAVRRRDIFSRNLQEIPQGSGTGFIWDESGLIVTNFHVIQGANKITITLQDQSSWDAQVVGLSPDKDLALLRIDAPGEQLKPLPLGDSSLLEVGRKVIAIGNPFGLDTTLTIGVVSALGREINSLSKRKIRDVIQTDASINPGNSGGPLLNSLGQLIGVNTQILSPSGASAGIGFAIPVNTVKKIIPQLVTYGREVRPVIGIENFPDSWTRQRGIKGLPILSVVPGLPAERAGLLGVQQTPQGALMLGDIIVSVDGVPVQSQDDLLNVLEQHKAGDKVNVVAMRNQESREFQVVLSDPPDNL